jgi:hypothetical protein
MYSSLPSERVRPWSIIALPFLVVACGMGTDNPVSSGAGDLTLLEVSAGFGRILPHTIRRLDSSGAPTPTLIEVRRPADLIDNLTPHNRILPTPLLPATPLLPSGVAGNQFLYARFNQALDPDVLLDPSPGGAATGGLTGAALVLAIDPVTGAVSPIPGRAFVGGLTVADGSLQRWLSLGAGGQVAVLDQRAEGFPGLANPFAGSSMLAEEGTFVFIPDTDGDLTTFETFPQGVQVNLTMNASVAARHGATLGQSALASTAVGEDSSPPDLRFAVPPSTGPFIAPADGSIDVDPNTTVRVHFREPIDPITLGGNLEGQGSPSLGSATKLTFGPNLARTEMPFVLRIPSVLDLSVWELVPATPFPGTGPGGDCPGLSVIDVDVYAGLVTDLSPSANQNQLNAHASFHTGAGPGLVNGPIVPEALIVGRGGPEPSLSIIDLNGMGQGTGDPSFDLSGGTTLHEDTNFPYDANLLRSPSLIPSLSVGLCSIEGGSAGAFTLTKDTNLDDRAVRGPVIADVTEMSLGQPLDRVYNAAPLSGCQSGAPNPCALDGLQVLSITTNGPTVRPEYISPIHVLQGPGNNASMAPHPNPPPLNFPPMCWQPLMLAQEPTSRATPPPGNVLGPGIWTHNPTTGSVPSGLPKQWQTTFFEGPSPGGTPVGSCLTYHLRQKIGQFLYVADRLRKEVVILDSNRMLVIDRIPMTDPAGLAVSPNLDVLAVTNPASDSVTFLDVDPTSSMFHQVRKSVLVPKGPRGLAWDPMNEDLLVACEVGGALAVISAASLEVRKVVKTQLGKPFDVVVTPRQSQHGFFRDVYFAFVLDRTGRVALFESGPNGVNGWGFDDVIGVAPFEFRLPKGLQPDPTDLRGAVWVLHEGPLDPITGLPGPVGEGALTKLVIESAVNGRQSLSNPLAPPNLRGISFSAAVSLGEPHLSGVPVDLAFDDLHNMAALPNATSAFSAGAPAPVNGKCSVRYPPAVSPRPTNTPSFMMVAVPNPKLGVPRLDVLNLASASLAKVDVDAFQDGVQGIEAPGVKTLVSYFRQ